MREPTTEQFLKDVKDHQLKSINEPGDCIRHLTFAKPDTNNMHFHIVTWPGYLAFSGDMGCFVFSRLRDMFEFFRPDQEEKPYMISYGYWAEKCQAEDKGEGVWEFDTEGFKETVTEWLNEWLEENEIPEEQRAEIRERLDEEVLSSVYDGEAVAREDANEFEVDDRRIFQDLWDCSFRKPTYRFVWCCHALRWAIAKYDEHKAQQKQGEAA